MTKERETRPLFNFLYQIHRTNRETQRENSTEKVSEQRNGEKKCDQRGAAKRKTRRGKEKGLFTQTCLMHLRYLVPQCLSFTSA